MSEHRTFHPGDIVSHAHRGEGRVHTVSIHPITKRPSKVLVHFNHAGSIQPVVCWPDDLTPRPSAIMPPAHRVSRPTLTVVA